MLLKLYRKLRKLISYVNKICRHIETAVLAARMSHVRTNTHCSLLSVIWVLVIQLLERLTRDQKVAGSIPVWGSETFFWVSDKDWSVVNNLPLNYMYSVEILVHAFVSSKLDYCNYLLYNFPKYVLNKLQFEQNTAARLITCSRKYDHTTPILIDLQWLPIANRLNSRFFYWLSRPYMNNLLSILKIWLLATSQLDFSVRRLPYAWTGLTIISSPRVPELSLFLLQNFGTICPKTLNLVTLFILLNLSLTLIFLK